MNSYLLFLCTTCLFGLILSYMMEKVDLVLMGAEGVVESGGIINKVSIELLQ